MKSPSLKKRAKGSKTEQMAFMNSKIISQGDIQYEGNYYHDYFRALPFAALKRLLTVAKVDLTRKSVLIASCGTGIDAHYLRKYYDPQFMEAIK
jgi:hypothetical protein